MEPAVWLRLIGITLFATGTLCPNQVLAQVPARFYWHALSGVNAVPLIVNSISGNTNPFDPSLAVIPGANISSTRAMAGFAKIYTLLGRSAMTAVLLPMGRLSGEVVAAGRTFDEAASGFGDPMIETDFSILGPRAQKNIPDALRYEPGFSVDLLADLAIPVGEYNSEQPLNL